MMARHKQIGIDVDVNGVIEQARQSFAETENDILRRLLLGSPPAGKGRTPSPRPVAGGPRGPSRSRGLWTVELADERLPAGSLKEAYLVALEQLQARFPDFLTRFSRQKGRARRYVARSPSDLYAKSPHLAEKNAYPLGGGWFVDTNLSTEQVAKRVKVAAHLCGLLYGRDFRLLDNLREI
jgi:hypothetical protein